MFNPRMLRAMEAPKYLGVGINYFNVTIRPHLTEIRLGPQMICFDRKELDLYADKLFDEARKKKEASNTPITKTNKSKEKSCPRKSQDSSKEATSGTSINRSEVSPFTKAREQLIEKKRRNI